MRPGVAWWVGLALMVAGGFGVAVSLAGLILVGVVEQRAAAYAREGLDRLTTNLDIAADGLRVANDTLTRAGITLAATRQTIQEAEQGLGSARQVSDRVSTVVGQEIPATLATTKTGLASAERAATVVDSTLAIVAVVIPGARPTEQAPPLAASIAAVSTSLDGLSVPMSEVSTDLKTASGDLQRVGDQLRAVAAGLGDLGDSLTNARSIVIRYQLVVDGLRQDVAALRSALPGWLSALRWGLSALLACLGFAQVGLLLQGWRLHARAKRAL